MPSTIDQLIINSPYEEPSRYWSYDRDQSRIPTLSLSEVRSLALDAGATATLAPVVEGKPDVSKVSEIDLEDLATKFRMQKIIFEAARDVYELMNPTWNGNREYLLAQLIRLVEGYIECPRRVRTLDVGRVTSYERRCRDS